MKSDSENERERETKTNEEEEEDDDDEIIIFDVAILGAGMSGVSCAREICFALRDDDFDEKNRKKSSTLGSELNRRREVQTDEQHREMAGGVRGGVYTR